MLLYSRAGIYRLRLVRLWYLVVGERGKCCTGILVISMCRRKGTLLGCLWRHWIEIYDPTEPFDSVTCHEDKRDREIVVFKGFSNLRKCVTADLRESIIFLVSLSLSLSVLSSVDLRPSLPSCVLKIGEMKNGLTHSRYVFPTFPPISFFLSVR